MKRYEKIVLEADEGIFFDVSEKEEGKLLVRASHKIGQKAMEIEQINHIKVLNTKRFIEKYVYYLYEPGSRPNYMNPPIPNNYEYVKGTWNDGFVIRRKEDGSEFVWVPVGSLKANGTLDGKNFDQQFGRRNWCGDDFSENGYYEPMTEELKRQLVSVEKHGGFYVARYDISMNKHTGRPQAIKQELPAIFFSREIVMGIADGMKNNSEFVSSHLIYGSEYDSVLQWYIESGEISKRQVRDKYYKGIAHYQHKTGTNEDWRANEISDFSENVLKVTQELWGKNKLAVLRGAKEYQYSPAGYRRHINNESSENYVEFTFRTALYIA